MSVCLYIAFASKSLNLFWPNLHHRTFDQNSLEKILTNKSFGGFLANKGIDFKNPSRASIMAYIVDTFVENLAEIDRVVLSPALHTYRHLVKTTLF